MKRIRIGILGGTRGMGLWLARLLQKGGHTVLPWGRGSWDEIRRLVPRCEVLVVSVPLRVTLEVIRLVGPWVPREGALMDLSSLKARPVAEMLSSSSSEVVGLHPLFGPRVRSLKGKTIVLCRARGDHWASWIEGFFEAEGARIVEMEPEKHDLAMASVQVLTHLNTMTMGLVLGELGSPLAESTSLATPVFERRLDMLRKVFFHNPELYAEIVALNPHSPKILEKYQMALGRLAPLVQKGDTYRLTNLLVESGLQAKLLAGAFRDR